MPESKIVNLVHGYLQHAETTDVERLTGALMREVFVSFVNPFLLSLAYHLAYSGVTAAATTTTRPFLTEESYSSIYCHISNSTSTLRT